MSLKEIASFVESGPQDRVITLLREVWEEAHSKSPKYPAVSTRVMITSTEILERLTGLGICISDPRPKAERLRALLRQATNGFFASYRTSLESRKG